LDNSFPIILLAHHLDVDGEAAALLGDGILQGPADGIGAQREPGIGVHVVGVGLLDSRPHGAVGVLAGLAIHAEEGQLHILRLDPSQTGVQGVGIEVGREVEVHREPAPAVDVASRIGLGLRTGIHAHLVDGAGVHGLITGLEVDYLPGDRGQHQEQADSQQRA